MKYIVYKNNIDKGGGSCSSESELTVYLNSLIQKFNHRYNKNIGFFSDELLEGESLIIAKNIIESELTDLIENYHIDSDPNGFGRSALKVNILGKERILDHFRCKLDQIIYSLDGLLGFFNRTIEKNGKVSIYGLGHIDVLDCNLIWELKKIIRETGHCTVKNLKKEIEYIFHIDGLIKRKPDIINERLKKLDKYNYLIISDDTIETTEKGKVVDVWTNFIEKTVTIEKEELKKRFANNGNRCASP
ncbi:hypothetical protein H2O64_16655 [Kordia sp. YSTF-M3]|uniref:Uncharacterized protein n=1 Tax=Kordia aestuariivivens TaxID=2759037 RepID=A0ABR7QCR3_9FLAO|nr:hypothetical protein [Kordia aestuariivivens]MBC8756307.1 hypothetical protein [Kordia aestuariivivens]